MTPPVQVVVGVAQAWAGGRLRWAVLNAGLSAGQAARLLNVPTHIVYTWMAGDNIPPEYCERVAELLDVSTLWLTTGEIPPEAAGVAWETVGKLSAHPIQTQVRVFCMLLSARIRRPNSELAR